MQSRSNVEYKSWTIHVANKCYIYRDRAIILGKDGAELELIDEHIMPKNSFGEMQQFLICQHICIHFKLFEYKLSIGIKNELSCPLLVLL